MGEIISIWLTSGNVADNNKNVVLKMCRNLYGKLFGDKGYISQKLFEELFENGISLFTTLKKNMKNRLVSMENRLFIMKRGVIESVIELLKSACDIDHTRHRSPVNAIVNVWAAIAAYCFFERKPSILMANTMLKLK